MEEVHSLASRDEGVGVRPAELGRGADLALTQRAGDLRLFTRWR